jgi:hypothetical protein
MISTFTGSDSFQNSFLAPIFFAHFLRLRYYHSAFTRTAVDDITSRIDNLAAGQAPPVQKVRALYPSLVSPSPRRQLLI